MMRSNLLLVLSLLCTCIHASATASADVGASGDVLKESGSEKRSLQHWSDPKYFLPASPESVTGAWKTDVIPDLKVRVSKDRFAGQILPSRGDLGINLPGAKTAREEIEEWLREHHETFGIKADLSDLRLTRESDQPSYQRFDYQQVFNNSPVRDGGIHVEYSPALSAISRIEFRIVSITDPTGYRPPGSPSDAITSAQKEVAGKVATTFTGSPKSELIVVARQGKPTPVWKIALPAGIHCWQALVDADSNHVFSVSNIAQGNCDNKD